MCVNVREWKRKSEIRDFGEERKSDGKKIERVRENLCPPPTFIITFLFQGFLLINRNEKTITYIYLCPKQIHRDDIKYSNLLMDKFTLTINVCVDKV